MCIRDSDNVTRLAVAWTYRTGDTARTRRPAKFEATPLMVDGTLYLSTPLGRAIALDPTTGKQRWNYDAQVDRDGKWGDFANRGVSTWVDSRLPSGAPCKRRIYLTTIDARIVALDAARGMPCRDFGQNGTVDLRRGLRNSPDFVEEYQLTSPPTTASMQRAARCALSTRGPARFGGRGTRFRATRPIRRGQAGVRSAVRRAPPTCGRRSR